MAALSLAYYNAKQDCHQLSIVKDQMQLSAADNNYIKSFLSCKLYSLLRNKKLLLCEAEVLDVFAIMSNFRLTRHNSIHWLA